MGNGPSKTLGGEGSTPNATSPFQTNPHSTRRKVTSRRYSTQPVSSVSNSHQALSLESQQSQAQSYTHTTTIGSRSTSTVPSRTRSKRSQEDSTESSPSRSIPLDDRMGNVPSRQIAKTEQHAEAQSRPVSVPRHVEGRGWKRHDPEASFEPSGPPGDPNYMPSSILNFPPRLPLPIQEEDHTPGSPIISPQEISSALQEYEVEGRLPKRTSILSSTTLDEDDAEEDLSAYQNGTTGRTVPTAIEWNHGGDRIYVTGSFAGWEKKYRMHRNPHTNGFSTIVELPPGTHHARFLVDGKMKLSRELPTAVDHNNILINYIEVSADDLPGDSHIGHEDSPRDGPRQLAKDFVPSSEVNAQDHKPNSVQEAEPRAAKKEKEKDKDKLASGSPAHYGESYPDYLVDLDCEDQSNRFRRAASGIEEIAPPPSLPLFLGKSILNGTTLMKDDASVLTMPNHTVLNHLSTSSIRNEILATSLTTRYKRKFLTTITYRPTTLDTD